MNERSFLFYPKQKFCQEKNPRNLHNHGWITIHTMLTILEKDIRKNLKYNLTVNLMDGSLFGVALGFASFSTILPLFVAALLVRYLWEVFRNAPHGALGRAQVYIFARIW